MKEIRVEKKDIVYLLLITFFLFLSVFSVYKLDKNNTTVSDINNYNSEFIARYTNVVKAEEGELLDFLVKNIDEEFVPMPVMDYIFAQRFYGMSKEGKAYLYDYYYANNSRFQSYYQELFKTSENDRFLQQIIDENPEANISDYETLYSLTDNIVLETIFKDMESNHFVLRRNGSHVEVKFDFDWFIDTFEDILDDDYRDFVELDKYTQTSVLVPDKSYFDFNVIIEIIHKAEDYIETHDNEYLNSYATDFLRVALNMYGCADYSTAFYKDTNDYEVADELLDSYNDYMNKYPDSKMNDLLVELKTYIKANDGKGYAIDYECKEIINNYMVKIGYISQEQLDYELSTEQAETEEFLEEHQSSVIMEE